METTNKARLISSKFLSNLFEAIRAEGKVEETKKIAKIEEYSDPDLYIDDSIQNLIGDTDRKIFVFLDEFEEIINFDGEILKDVLSGIKETVNGQYKDIDENGKMKVLFI